MDNSKPPLAERVRTALSALGTTPYKFANEHGFNRTSMFNLTNVEKHPSFDLVERICEVEPRISAEYLLRGKGNPLLDAAQAESLTTVEQLQAFKAEMIQVLDRRIEQLQ